MIPYSLALHAHPGYLHAKVEGERTPENALRFFEEVHAACVERGIHDVLMEMNLSGPSLDTVSVFRVISQRSPHAHRWFRRMAYVEHSENLDKARFAENIAVNRGVNVRLFTAIAPAIEWLAAPQEQSAHAR